MAGIKASADTGELSLNKTAKTLKEVAGIEVYSDKSQGKLKSMTEVLDEVHSKWKDLNDEQRAGLSEAIAGKQQSAVFNAIMKNYKTYQDIQEEFKNNNHLGSMEQENARYIDSISGKLAELKAIWTDIFSDIFTADAIKGVLDGFIAISEVIRDLVSLTSELGVTFPALFATFGGMGKAFKGISKESKGIKQVQKGLMEMGVSAKDTATIMTTLDSSNKKTSKSFKDIGNGAKESSKGMKLLDKGTSLVGNGLSKATGFAKSFFMGFGQMFVITAAVQGLAKAWDMVANKNENALEVSRQNVQTTKDELKSEQDKLKFLKENSDRYEELQKKKEQYLSSGKDLTDEQLANMDELKGLSTELAELFPQLVIKTDENGIPELVGDMDKYVTSTENAISAKERLLEAELRMNRINATKNSQNSELFEFAGTGTNLAQAHAQYNKQLENYDAGFFTAYKKMSKYEDDFINSSGKKRDGAFKRYIEQLRYKEEAEYESYSNLQKAYGEHMQLNSEILESASVEMMNKDSFIESSKETQSAMKELFSGIDWAGMDISSQEKWISSTDKLVKAFESGKPEVKSWAESINKANREYALTGDQDRYAKSLEGVAKGISQVTGMDLGIVTEGLTQAFAGLDPATQKLQTFMQAYGKSVADLNNGDSVAEALKSNFEGINDLFDQLAQYEDVEITPKIRMDFMTSVANNKDIPKEIADLAKEYIGDDNVTELEHNLMVNLITELKSGDKKGADEVLKEINEVREKAGKEPIRIDMKATVNGKEEVKELKDSLKDLPETVNTLIDNQVVGKEDVEELKSLLGSSELSEGKVIDILLDNQDAIQQAGSLKGWLDSIPPETWTTLGVKEEGIEEAKEGLEGVVDKQKEVNTNESTIKVNGDETQSAIEDINDLISHSSKLEDGTYNIDFKTNVGDTISQLGNVTNAVNEVSKAFGGIPNKSINVETGVAARKITGLTKNIEKFNNMSNGVKVVKFNSETGVASRKVTGLRTNVQSYVSKYCGKTHMTKFNAETGVASRKVTGLKSNVSSFVNSYCKSFTTTFNVVTKYSTIGSPTAQSSGKKPGKKSLPAPKAVRRKRSIEPMMMRRNVPTLQSAPDVEPPMMVRNVQPLGANPMVRTPVMRDVPNLMGRNTPSFMSRGINAGSVIPALNTDVNLLENLENVLKDVNNQLDILDKKADNAFGNDKIKYLTEQNTLLKRQQDLQHQLANSLRVQQNEYKYYLTTQGIHFDNLGNATNITNELLYMEKELLRLQSIADNAGDNEKDGASKKAKEYSDNLDSLKRVYNAYASITFDKLPAASEEWFNLNNEIQKNTSVIKELKAELDFADEINSIEKLNNELGYIGKELDFIDAKLDNLNGSDKTNAMQEQISLYRQKQQELHKLANSYRVVQAQLKDYLNQYGFMFENDGKLNNYENLNNFTGTKELEDIKKALEEYIELTNEKIPGLSAEWWKVESSIKDVEESIGDVNKELSSLQYENSLEPFRNSIEEVGHAIDRVHDKMVLLDELYENVYGKDKLDYYDKTIGLLEQEKDLLKQQYNEYLNIHHVMKGKLSGYGVNFDASSLITNYDEVLNKFIGSENYDEIKGYLDKYIDLTRDKIQDCWKEYLELDNKIKDMQKEQLETTKDVQDKIMDIYKKQVEERKKLIQEELDKRLEALDKEKEAYNDSREKAEYDEKYKDQLEKIQELQSQYDKLSGDTSLGNKKKLQELLDQIEEEKEKLEDLTQSQIDKDVNGMIDDEKDRLESDADKEVEHLEDKYSDENLQGIVNGVLNTGIFEDIDGKLHSIQDVMIDYINKYEDGLLATGGLIKSEWITNLEIARDTLKEMVDINSNLGLDKYSQGRMSSRSDYSRSSNSVSFNAPMINIEGNVDRNVMDELKGVENRIAKKVANEVMAKVNGR